ncbi:ABC transporter permease [Cutibacterium equinum]|uniref:ABC transporter permease n=1 Tax=Cutibacterium equinum TaxID=3016342 RepID=A0ABY7QZL4_9ACTN|nr:ABC transporter permease [Cutibacterium equinum]WCC80483.1 ABC transporter permease [Cutibacterium equinum]
MAPVFLALREIGHQRGRFALIVAVIALIAYLAFFLASLATGLAHSYRSAIDDWDATSVALTEDSNESVMSSRLSKDQVKVASAPSDAEPLIVSGVVLKNVDSSQPGRTKVSAFAFAIDRSGFLAPDKVGVGITQGRGIEHPDSEIVVDDTVVREGWQVGDKLQLNSTSHTWTIVGFTHDQTFQTTPIVFVDEKAFGKNPPTDAPVAVNAVVNKDGWSGSQTDDLNKAGLTTLSSDEFVKTLAGYKAQVLTFSLMIGALVVIASFALGIFIYVLTLQKRAALGILKARGVPTSYLVRSGAVQTLLLALVGLAVGLVLTLLTGAVLPDKVPFWFTWWLYAVITAAFALFSVIGGLLSVKVISGIDPVEAMS